jgi:two-component system chemotaxis sensor kinase CheA
MELANGITQEDLKLFLQEADEQLQLLNEDIVRLEKEADNPDLMQEIFRAAHTLKGSSAMVGNQRLSELAHAAENVLDSIRKKTLAINPQIIDALLHGLDVMMLLRKEMTNPEATAVEIRDVVAELNTSIYGGAATVNTNANQTGSLVLDEPAKAGIATAKQAGKQVYQIKVKFQPESGWVSVRCFQMIQYLTPIADIIVSIPSQEEIEKGNATNSFELIIASHKNEDEIKNVLSSVAEQESIEITKYQIVEQAPPTEKTPVSEPSAPKLDEVKSSQTVRVDIGRLDTLMEQVGELVINRNQISQIGKTLEKKYQDDEVVISLISSVSQIAKIISTLQQDVMAIRLLPIEIVFNTLPRMVRDMARKENKKITFSIEGQETEVDRSVIEHLRDPLVHLLRNAIDHGIESPEERLASGKPEVGTIKLSAYHENDNIVIKLEDDGRGINPATIRETAIKKGLLSKESATQITDGEAIEYIFASGFSTAKSVTEISGRGVGLDIVKTNIEALSGSVRIESKVGLGTTFIVTLPLTLAIIPALLVNIKQTICAIPLLSIVETCKLEIQGIKTIRGREVALLRGSVLPLLRLNEIFGWEDEAVHDNEIIHVVVVKYASTQVGMIVDGFLEQQELVVKSIDQSVSSGNGITGASILGDGRVVLILDTASLIRATFTLQQNNGEQVMVVSGNDA